MILKRIALALILPPLLVELLLQLGAFAMSLRAEPAAAPGERCAVLCVGDSFTWGFGASDTDHAYPAQLEKLLRAAPIDGESRVVNGGWPGRDSRGVLQELPRQLETTKPRIVAVLVGVNDLWSQPAPFRLDDATPASSRRFRLEWRTLRLLKLIFAPAATTPPTTASASEPQGGPNARRQPNARQAGASRPNSSSGPNRANAARKVAHPELMREARSALASGKPERFVPACERWLAAEPDEPRAHELRVEAAVKARDAKTTEAELRWLAQRQAERPELGTVEALVRALTAANQLGEAGAVAQREVSRFGESALLWTAIATAAMNAGEEAPAEQAITRAIEVSADDADAAQAWRHRMRAKLRMKRDALQESAGDLLQAYCLDPDDDATRPLIRSRMDAFQPAMFEAAGNELGLPREQVARVLALLAETADPSARGGLETLADHLRQLVRYCRERGVEPVLIGYPVHSDEVDGRKQQVARELDVLYVALTPRFDQLLQGRDRSELFVADGHCNDAGYEVMAREVEAALRASVKKVLK